MNRKVTVVVLGIVILILTGCASSQTDPACRDRIIEFKMKKSEFTQEELVFAFPEVLDNVSECADVIFINTTPHKITVTFLPRDDEKTLFAGVTEFELNEYESDGFSSSFPVAVVLTNDTEVMEFKYHVEPKTPPEKEQSPRIRVGPRKTSNN